MTSLIVRRPAFRIDASVPFQWQPANPSFGLFANTFTFLAIAFERYIVAATRQAMPRITDPADRRGSGCVPSARRPSTRAPTACTPTP